MDDKQTSSPFMKMMISFLVGSLLVFVTAIVTLYMTKTLHPNVICGASSGERLTFGREDNWSAADHYDIPGKDVTITRTPDKCYISPLQERKDNNKANPMQLVHDPLSEEMVEALGGPVALEICEGLTPYMLKNYIPEMEQVKRTRRQAIRANPAQDVSNYDESKNENRCMDLIMICPESVNQKSECWTGINGLFWMERTCTTETEIVIQMTKPPGRLIKLIRNEWIICQKRRRAGLGRC